MCTEIISRNRNSTSIVGVLMNAAIDEIWYMYIYYQAGVYERSKALLHGAHKLLY